MYRRLSVAATAEGRALAEYLARSFESVNWVAWLALMIPYCITFFVIDTFVVWRVINWFNARIAYSEIIPIRASSYIISLVNEQVSKGAMAMYLNRRHGVPAWEIGSSMLFLMVCEYYSLLLWATFGVFLRWEEVPASFHAIPLIAVMSLTGFVAFYLFFRGSLGLRGTLVDRPIFHAFRVATLKHYAATLAFRAPLLLFGIVVYTRALRLFGGTVSLVEMLSYLPLVFFGAAVPGPMHSVAILFWVLLLPAQAGQMTAFGFVQHNFFILFNASIGLIFLRRATRDLFARP